MWECACLTVIILIVALGVSLWIGRKSNGITLAVRSATHAVLKAYVWSRISGSYWENEMLRQAKLIAALTLPERLEFYKTMILNCDLDTSRALLFVEVVGDDAESLRQDLSNVKGQQTFRNLTDGQRKAVEDWIEEFRPSHTAEKATNEGLMATEFAPDNVFYRGQRDRQEGWRISPSNPDNPAVPL